MVFGEKNARTVTSIAGAATDFLYHFERTSMQAGRTCSLPKTERGLLISVVSGYHRFLSVRFVTVVVILAAWLLATNHCALGFMPCARGAKAHQCCAQEADSPPPDHSAMPCCQALRASLPSIAKVDLPTLPVLSEVAWRLVDLVDLVENGEPASVCCELDHGPPGTGAPITILLRRSQPALAPPVLG
jgi:hypothetical protein